MHSIKLRTGLEIQWTAIYVEPLGILLDICEQLATHTHTHILVHKHTCIEEKQVWQGERVQRFSFERNSFFWGSLLDCWRSFHKQVLVCPISVRCRCQHTHFRAKSKTAAVQRSSSVNPCFQGRQHALKYGLAELI